MNTFGYFVISAWAPLTLSLFAKLDARKAVVVAFVLGTLFLPEFEETFLGLPDVSKGMLIALPACLGVILFSFRDIVHFKFEKFDLLPCLAIIGPYFSSTKNGLGGYDGISVMFDQLLIFGIPYFTGRILFSDLRSKRLLAIGFLLGGLIYIPFCLYELRMSPQIHRMVYGYFPHDFIQTYRYGGWRPQVFLNHGIMLGMWMTSASLVGVWFLKTKILRGQLANTCVLALLVTTVLCKSTLAILLLLLGTGTLLTIQRFHGRLAILMMLIMPVAYIGARATQTWSGEELITYSESLFGERRAGSVATRINNENILLDRALQKPLIGWGRGNHRPEDVKTITDGKWIIVFGMYGWIGLVAFFGTWLLAILRFMRIYPTSTWTNPLVAPSAVLVVLILLYTLDSLFNSFPNPILMAGVGGLMGQTKEPEEEV